MVYQNLIVARSAEGFATVTLNRPHKLNTLSIALRLELAKCVDELDADPAVRVLIVTGAGRAFSAGLDLDEWTDGGSAPAAAAWEHDAVAALLRFRGPVVGAVNGLAITGGLELALACDVLVASSEAQFADTHVTVGLLPGWGGSARMVQRVGLHRAKELAFTGRFLGADEALDWGLVNRVVPPEGMMDEAQAIARQMLAAVPAGLIAYKRLLDDEAGHTLTDALRIERDAAMAHNTKVSRAEVEARLARLRRQSR